MKPGRKNTTVSEFLAWDSGDDARHELLRGQILAMAPATQVHQTIAGNLSGILRTALRARRPKCRVLVEAGIAVGREDTAYIADLAVTCEPVDRDARLNTAPLLIVEILSPSTERSDRTTKLIDYRGIPSVEEILLLEQDQMFCELHRRVEQGWMTDLLRGGESLLELRSIQVEVPLSEIYENVPFD